MGINIKHLVYQAHLDLLARCQPEDMETIITRERRRWTRHVLGEVANSITKNCNPLDLRGKAEAWSAEDNLVKNYGSGNEDHEPQLGHHPEAGQ